MEVQLYPFTTFTPTTIPRPAAVNGTEAAAYREGGLGDSNPPPEIRKALQNRAKLNPTVKNVKNFRI